MKKYQYLYVFLFGASNFLFTQEVFEGYTLFTPQIGLGGEATTYLIDNDYNYSHECDDSMNQYSINPLKYHDAILVFTFDKPITNLTKKRHSILKKLEKFFYNNTFNLNQFYLKYKVDIPIKYIHKLNN